MFSYAQLLCQIREAEDELRLELGELRDAIFKLGVKEFSRRKLKEKLNVLLPAHAAVFNEVGEEYLRQQPDSVAVRMALTGESADGEREAAIARGDFSFTHDDSAQEVFDKIGRTSYTSGWEQANIFRYITVCMALINHRPPGSKTQTVIDVGCSTGTWLLFWYKNMQRAGKQKLLYTGIEVVQRSVDIAALRWEGHENLKFIQGDVIKSPLEELHPDKADAVLLLEVIEHIGLEPARALLRQTYDRLNENGIVAISSPNPAKHLGQEFVWKDNHLYEFSLPEMKQELIDAGFEILDVTGWFCSITSLKRVMSPEEKALHARLNSLGSGVAGALMAYLMPEHALHYTIIARKPQRS